MTASDDGSRRPPDREASANASRGSKAGTGAAIARRVPTVAVVGNPNAGKSTIFNRLTGLTQKVGNYPGVTVEKKEGVIRVDGRAIRLVDLPGTYSLAAHSPDEIVAVDVILGQQRGEARPDLVVDVVDASNLERNLYLFSQLRELGVAIVLAVNMTDVAKRRGIEIDCTELSRRLGVPVVACEGHRGIGLDELRASIARACDESEARTEGTASPPAESWRRELPELPPALEKAARELARALSPIAEERLGRAIHPFEALRALVDRSSYSAERLRGALGARFDEALAAARSDLDFAEPLSAVESRSRYAWIRDRVAGSFRETPRTRRTLSERVDDILTHRVLGLVIFAAVMLLLFQSIFTWAEPLMGAIETVFAALGDAAGSVLPEGALRSLIVDGVIAGVGGVLVFLPQILLLFLFIGVLEDCGYMARAAFVVDRVMSHCGLSGKSFIPMLSGFACAIPGIMAARVIEDRRDRLVTILVVPLMTCSARLPVYALLVETFVPDESYLGGMIGLPALVLFALYLLGMLTAIAMAFLFKRTLLRGATPAFLLELPSYKIPSLRSVAFRLYDRAIAFLRRAGTIILAVSIVVWALLYFPRPAETGAPFEAARARIALEEAAASTPEERARLEEALAEIDREETGAYVRASYFGRLGRAVEPVFEPLGWDWRISMAAIASFPAREIVVSTLGTIYNLGGEEDETSESLRERLREARHDDTGEPVYTLPVVFSVLVFFALCCQCAATLATIRRETGGWRWALWTFAYMTVLAYLGALAAYQIGRALT